MNNHNDKSEIKSFKRVYYKLVSILIESNNVYIIYEGKDGKFELNFQTSSISRKKIND